MKAVILAAGEGNRMSPLTRTHLKPMLPVGNIPFLAHTISNLQKAGISEIIIVTGSTVNALTSYFKDGSDFEASIEYIVQEHKFGTAHAIGLAKPLIKEDERFLVIGGDTIVHADELEHMLNYEAGTIVGVMVVDSNQNRYGVLEFQDQYISKITEKPEFALSYKVNAGVYIFDSSIFESIIKTNMSVRGELEITDSIQQLIDNGKKVKYTVFDDVVHISNPWDLLDFNKKYLSTLPKSKQINSEIDDNVHISGSVIIQPNTRVRSGVYIEGPVIIGSGCDIGPNCYIRPYTTIGDHVHIGSSVEIKSSIIMDSTKIGHFTYIGDSIIGKNCNFGAGTQVANLRHDNQNITVTIDDVKIDTERRKLGTIMGDNVHTGINSMLNAGSVIEPGSFIYPGEFVKRYCNLNRYNRKEAE